MRIFHCDHCGHLLFFENTHCIACGHPVAYLPDLGVAGSLDEAGDGVWRSPIPRATGGYRLCRNYTDEQVCNWAIPEAEAGAQPPSLCRSCRLTTIVPDLSVGDHRTAWYRLEAAKRRLLATLLALELPVLDRSQDPEHGLAFEFKADAPDGTAPVLTGHAHGVITINIAEADDAERERRRTTLHEPYRTLLGHMRHESGHYYWERLVEDRATLDAFRRLFGDERRDYADALGAYHTSGPPPDWQTYHVSAYAAAHPWEDFAETWAHYLHMVDTLETAAACGLSLQPVRRDEPAFSRPPLAAAIRQPFDRLIDRWFPLTYVLNNLNRGLGLPDGYPFVLSPPTIDKLRFVHDLMSPARPD